MTYNIGITVINGHPKVTSFGGDLPEATISVSGSEPTAGYEMRNLGVTLYGADSKFLATTGTSVPAHWPGAIPAPDPVQPTIDEATAEPAAAQQQ